MEIVENTIEAIGIRFSVLEEGNEIGRAFLYILNNDLHKEPFGLMEDVFVSESARGRGMGTELIKAVIASARKQGCYKLIATSREERELVHKLYERLGFRSWGKEFRMDFKSL